MFDFLRKKKDGGDAAKLRPTEGPVRVVIPEEKLVGAEAQDENGVHIGVFNVGALGMEPKPLFGWRIDLSMLPLVETDNDVVDEKIFVDMQDYCDHLSEVLKSNPEHPNSIFIWRITQWPQMDCVWYVNNPELAHTALQDIIASGKNPFAFRYEIKQDREWECARHYLDPLVKK